MGIPERKEREREQRKAIIMDCAMKTFLSKGFINASMEDIAICSELSKATLYLYFKNKEELILNVMYDVISKLVGYLESRMSGADSAQDKIRMIAEAYLDFYDECHGHYLLLNSQESTAGMDFLNLEGYQEYLNQYNKFWTVLCAPFYVAIEEGFFRKDSNAVEIAITLWSSLKGLMQNMDKVVQTIKCEEYQKMVEQKQVKHNEFQTQLFTLDYKKMLRHLSEAITLSFQNK
jgi:TetR/AcrR family transcriptional regulator